MSTPDRSQKPLPTRDKAGRRRFYPLPGLLFLPQLGDLGGLSAGLAEAFKTAKAVAVLLLLLASQLMPAQCQTRGCSPVPSSSVQEEEGVAIRAAVAPDAASVLNVWIDIGATGVYSPSLNWTAGIFRPAQDAVEPLPSYLDDLAQNGYLGIRVPHAPPTYTLSSLVQGIPPFSYHGAEFSYYAPPDASEPTVVPITLTRVVTYEAILDARYPISDDHSHWEAWWIEGDSFPIPTKTFALKDDWPQALEITFHIDFGSGADALSCAGCMVEGVLYNGHSFIDPVKIPLIIETYPDPPPVGNPLVMWDMYCGNSSNLQYVTPTVPFTHTHWLGNAETVTRTYTIQASSSQGWDYAYSYGPEGGPLEPAASLPFTVTVGPADPVDWPPVGCLQIVAVATPPISYEDAMRETFRLTAISTVSPGVQAETVSFALAPSYELPEEGPIVRIFLPLVMRASNR